MWEPPKYSKEYVQWLSLFFFTPVVYTNFPIPENLSCYFENCNLETTYWFPNSDIAYCQKHISKHQIKLCKQSWIEHRSFIILIQLHKQKLINLQKIGPFSKKFSNG